MSREEWRRSRQGKKVVTPLLRHRRSRLQPPFGQINPSERPLVRLVRTELTSRRTWRFASPPRELAQRIQCCLALCSGDGRISASAIAASAAHAPFTRAVGRSCDPSPFGRCRTTTATKLPLCDDRSSLDAQASLSVAQRQESRARRMPDPVSYNGIDVSSRQAFRSGSGND